jgi:hypothetical protein
MSGSPVWRCTFRKGSAIDAKLVGVAIEYHRKVSCFVVSRVSVVLSLIKYSFPDLAELLPKMPSYASDIFTDGAR